MKPYALGPFELIMSPNMAIVDSNVLIAAFIPSEGGQHEAAKAFLELWGESGIALVPVPVLIEAWGMIVGSRKNRSAGLAMLGWALDPMLVRLIPGDGRHTSEVSSIATKYNVDVVDAWILFLVTDIYIRCELSERVRIATFDIRDFLPCTGRFPLRLYDIDAGEDMDF